MGASYNDDLVTLKLASGNEVQFSALARQKVNNFEQFYLDELQKEFEMSKKLLSDSDLSQFTDGTLIALALTLSDLNDEYALCTGDLKPCDQCNKKLSEFVSQDSDSIINDCTLGELKYGLFAQEVYELPFNFSGFNGDKQIEVMNAKLSLISKEKKTDNIVNQFLYYLGYELNESFLVDFENKKDSMLIEGVKLRFNLALVTDFLNGDVREFEDYNDKFKEDLVDDFSTSFAFNTIGDEFLKYQYPRFYEYKLNSFNLDFNCSLTKFQDSDSMTACLNSYFDDVAVETNYETKLLSYIHSNQSNCYVSGGNSSKLLNLERSDYYLLENKSLTPIDSNTNYAACRIENNFALVNLTLKDRLPETILTAYLDLGVSPDLNLNYSIETIPGVNRYFLFTYRPTNLSEIKINNYELNDNSISYFDTAFTDDILFIENGYIILNDRTRLNSDKLYFNLKDKKYYYLIDTKKLNINEYLSNNYQISGFLKSTQVYESNFTLDYNQAYAKYIDSDYLGYQNGAHQFKLKIDDTSLDNITKISNFNVYFAINLLEFYQGYSYINEKIQISRNEIFEYVTDDQNLTNYAFVSGENKYAKLNNLGFNS